MSAEFTRHLLLWRHGRTEWNADGRVQGQEDVSLDAVGRRQAVAAAPTLAAERPALIISSDLRRAHDTAKVLAEHADVPLQLDPRLRERCFGVWEGLNSEQMAAKWPEEFALWRSGGEPDVEGIETEAEITARVSEAIESALRATDGTVCLVTHGGVVKRALAVLLDWPSHVPWGFDALGNCRWAQLRTRSGGRWRLSAYNIGVACDTAPTDPNANAADVEPAAPS
jgi:probable phosphoglycerate mutase